MRKVRPWQFFEMYSGSDRDVVLPIPHRKGLGSLMLLESFVILTAARIVGAKRMFEIGTYLGATSFILAGNNPDARVFTLDLGPEEAKNVQQIESESEITSIHLGSRMDFDGTPEAERINVLHGNSLSFDFSPFFDSIDLALIDAGHELPNVKSDTENSLKIIRPQKSCILWHDYGNPDYPELKTYLDGLQLDILHIEDTWLCAYIRP